MESKDRIEKCMDLRSKGLNCAQCVFAAYSDIYGINEDTALNLTSGLGGGIGKMREVCGAALGMFMLAGLEKGRQSRVESETLVQDLAKKYKEIYGSLICGEILGMRPMKDDVTEIQKQNCKESCTIKIKRAAEIYADYLEKK